MLLGRVIGTVWATRKDPKLDGMKLQVVQSLDPKLAPLQPFVVAIDSVGAGVGEIVLLAQGSSARQTRETKDKPVDAVIMAIVDSLEVEPSEALQARYERQAAPILDRLDRLGRGSERT